MVSFSFPIVEKVEVIFQPILFFLVSLLSLVQVASKARVQIIDPGRKRKSLFFVLFLFSFLPSSFHVR